MATQTTERSLDELAKGLATGTLSRGKAIRWMGGALLGAALASFPGVAWADDDRCSEGQTRCGERCVNLQRNERHCGRCGNRCPEGSECVGGTCSAVATTLLLCQCNSPGGGGSTIAVCLSGDCDTLQADAQTICDPLCEFGFSGSAICQPDSPECGGGGG
jgi:hypothetical protein